MGIYISGLNMPDRHTQIVIHADGSVSVFDDTSNCFQETNAQAVQVQTHGRLIDEDALDDVCVKLNEDSWGITVGDHKFLDRVIFEFPTIIPEDHFGEGTEMVQDREEK